MVVVYPDTVDCQAAMVIILDAASIAGMTMVSSRELVDLAIVAEPKSALVSILEVNEVLWKEIVLVDNHIGLTLKLWLVVFILFAQI